MNDGKSKYSLVFDDECPLCSNFAALAARSGAVEPSELEGYSKSDDLLKERARAAEIHNGLVAVNSSTGETRSGVDGILAVMEHRLPSGLHRFLRSPKVERLLQLLYGTVAYNRRIISPPRLKTVNRGPDFSRSYRLALIVFSTTLAIFITAGFGALVFERLALGSAFAGACFMLGAAGSGWGLLFVTSLIIPPRERLDYLAHLGVTMTTGVLLLLPGTALLMLLSPLPALAVVALSVLVSFVRMSKRHRDGISSLRLPLYRHYLWIATLLGSFAVWCLVWFRCAAV